jgi:hypothetical protein
MAKAKKKNETIVFEQLDNKGTPTGHKRSFTPTVASRLLRTPNCKWRMIEQAKPKERPKAVISEEEKRVLRQKLEKMPKDTAQLIDWIKRQHSIPLLEMAKENTQSPVGVSAISDRIKELTNTKK